MDYGGAAGWDSLPRPAHADRFVESQQAGLTAMLGIAADVAPAASVSGMPVIAPRAGAVEIAAPAELVPSQRTGVLVRPAPAHPADHGLARQTPLALPEGPAKPPRRFAHLPGLSLMIVILTVQAALSARLLTSNTAFDNEARYLRAGHLQWAHWLHGISIPAYATRFSGSPVVYPPIGALADSLGGLTGARILSLCFMLGATCLLWGTAARLFGRPAAYFAAGLFAVLGPTLHLGAFATFDAMGIFLIALAAWCACGRRTMQDATGWILGCAAALVLANATKYATAIFDPVIVIIAVLSACPYPGGKAALRRGALLVTCVAGSLAALLRIGGPWYVTGIGQTTTLRQPGAESITRVLAEAWGWTAVVVVVALAGLALSLMRKSGRTDGLMIFTLAASCVLVPVEQMRDHTVVSLAEHVDIGAWFACIAGGYALAVLASLPRPRWVRFGLVTCMGAALTLVAAAGVSQAQAMVNWPASTQLISSLRPLVWHGGRFLAENDDVPQYYLPGTSWRQWSDTSSITLANGQMRYVRGDAVPYTRAIRRHFFSIVILNFTQTPAIDRVIESALGSTPGYRRIGHVDGSGPGSYVIWAYIPSAAPQGRS
jgi:4-amino-4-deoxy-L-arabinose transferase-like glycosyltransferase